MRVVDERRQIFILKRKIPKQQRIQYSFTTLEQLNYFSLITKNI